MELFRLHGIIEVDNKNANQALDETSKKGKETESKLGKFFSGIGKGAVVVGKAVGAGLAAGGAAMGTLTVKAMNLGGELEQNMGGSEAVFKEYAGSMQETAKTAFSNMGLSTSDYLATANKMGALFQGAGFSIEESMNLSSSAMQRAADVASIMGIDTSAAMEAVAGAAKGNFTMMDNLGVAMNATTIEAYALSKGCETAYKDMDNQTKIGYAMEMFLEKTAYATGNYAKENETLAGSLGTAKAALTNFLDGSGSVDQLVTAFSNAADVIVKNLKEIAPRLISGLTEVMTQISPKVTELICELLPTVVNGAIALMNGLVAAAPSLVSTLMNMLPAIIDGVLSMVTSLVASLPQIMQILFSGISAQAPALLFVIGDMITGIANFIQTSLPVVTEKAKTMMTGFGEKIKESLPEVISKGLDILLGLSETILANLPTMVASGMDLLKSIVIGIVNALPELLAKAPEIITNFANTISRSMQTIFMKGIEIIWELIKGIIGAIPDLIANIPKIIEAIFAVWNAVNWMSLGKNLMTSITNGIKNMGGSLKNTAKDIFTKLGDLIGKIFQTIKSLITNPINTAKSLFTSAISGMKSFATSAFNALKSSVSSIFNGIKNAIKNPIESAANLVKNVINKIKGFFKFKISWPHIPMPHFGISPSGWSVGDLLKGSIPRLSIQWYKAAMDNPMIMTKPTIFGYDAGTGQLMGGGEAGSEVVSGTNTLMSMIQAAVEVQNNALAVVLYKILDAILALDGNMGGNLRAALAGTSFEINKREFARLVKAVN